MGGKRDCWGGPVDGLAALAGADPGRSPSSRGSFATLCKSINKPFTQGQEGSIRPIQLTSIDVDPLPFQHMGLNYSARAFVPERRSLPNVIAPRSGFIHFSGFFHPAPCLTCSA